MYPKACQPLPFSPSRGQKSRPPYITSLHIRLVSFELRLKTQWILNRPFYRTALAAFAFSVVYREGTERLSDEPERASVF